MRTFFFGTSAFAVPILAELADRADVSVVTQPDRPAGRGQKLAATPVALAARERGLPVFAPTDLRAFAATLSAAAPDVCVVASYGRIVPQALLGAAPLWLNVHPSLLPLYRGATPIQSAIRDGRTTTAVSIIAMDAGMDTGDLIAQTPPIPIGERETYGELHDRLARLGAQLLAEVLDARSTGTMQRASQAHRAGELGIDEATIAATVTRPLKKEDYRIETVAAGATAKAVVDRIRALTPPGAVGENDDVEAFVENIGLGRIRLTRAHATGASPVRNSVLMPGRIVANAGFLFIGATDGWAVVDEVHPPGKRPMSIVDWANGHTLSSANVALADRTGDLLPA